MVHLSGTCNVLYMVMQWAETFNHVFGRTTNPHNTSLTSGGSSGGEGALLALKGSPLGVGTDIGGCFLLLYHRFFLLKTSNLSPAQFAFQVIFADCTLSAPPTSVSLTAARSTHRTDRLPSPPCSGPWQTRSLPFVRSPKPFWTRSPGTATRSSCASRGASEATG